MAAQGRAAIAFSLDNHRATTPDDFATAAQLSVTVIKAALGLLKGDATPKDLLGNVINVNFPFTSADRGIKGFHLSHMSSSCVIGQFSNAPPAEAAAVLRQNGIAPSPEVQVMVNKSTVFEECASLLAVLCMLATDTPVALAQCLTLCGLMMSRAHGILSSEAVGHNDNEICDQIPPL